MWISPRPIRNAFSSARGSTLEDDDGEQANYRIVGPDEFDAGKSYISMDAPLGRALLGKAIDDEVKVETPAGAKTYVIVSVRYERQIRAE